MTTINIPTVRPAKKGDERITLTIDRDLAQVLMNATGLFTDVLCGRYETIADRVISSRLDTMGLAAARSALRPLKEAKKAQFPELSAKGSYAPGFSKDTAISNNIYLAVRDALYQETDSYTQLEAV